MLNKRSIVGVMGSGHLDDNFPHVAPLGAKIAEMGFHILTGGGFGVMQEAARGFTEFKNRKGLALGILPMMELMTNNRFDEYPNPYVEINIQTHLLRDGGPDDPFTRNHINILTANALVFCPGNAGTHCELDLAIRYKTPAILYMGGAHTIDKMSVAQLQAYGLPMVEELKDVEAFLRPFQKP